MCDRRAYRSPRGGGSDVHPKTMLPDQLGQVGTARGGCSQRVQQRSYARVGRLSDLGQDVAEGAVALPGIGEVENQMVELPDGRTGTRQDVPYRGG